MNNYSFLNNLKTRITNLREHRFVKNVATLQSGSFLGSLIQGFSGIFLARLLQPELYGVYVLAFGLSSLVSLFLGIGVQDAIASVLGYAYARKDRVEIKEALGFLVKITIILGVITLIAALFAPYIAAKFYHNFKIGEYAAIVVLASIISTSFFSFCSIIFRVTNKIRKMNFLIIADLFVRYFLSVLLVFLGLGVLGAMFGHLLGAIFIFIISVLLWESLREKYPIFPSTRSLIIFLKTVNLKKYLGFSFWVAIDKNLGNLFVLLPVLITGFFVSASNVAYFKLAFGYMNLVLGLLAPISILLNVEFPKMRVENETKMRGNFIKVSLYSLVLSTLMTIGAIIISPIFFRYLYGVSFLPSVKYIFGLFIYGIVFGLGVGLGSMWRAINKVKISIMINLIVLGIGVPLGFVFVKVWGLPGAVLTVTLWYTASHLASFIYLVKKLKKL